MTTELIPRPHALAKLLQHGDLTHEEAAAACGWGWEGFKEVARAAREAGLIHHRNVCGTRVYRAGASSRRVTPQRHTRHGVQPWQ